MPVFLSLSVSMSRSASISLSICLYLNPHLSTCLIQNSMSYQCLNLSLGFLFSGTLFLSSGISIDFLNILKSSGEIFYS